MNKPQKLPTVEDALTEMDARRSCLAAALIAAQAELHAPPKNKPVKVKSQRTGKEYSFEYATLDAIIENLLRPVLPKYGLWFTQLVIDGHMVTRILHESGEVMDCGIPMLGLPNAPQEAGSIITYFKRYSLCAAFGLVAEEDDDANVAEGNEYAVKRITQAQFEELERLREKAGVSSDRFCKRFNIDAIALLPAKQFDDAKAALENKIKEPA